MNSKLKVFGIVLAAAMALTACSTGAPQSSAAEGTASKAAESTQKTTIKYGKASGPYTVLFEDAIKPILEKKGYKLEAVEFSDLLQNDTALNNGEIDVNVEQHTAYAENFNKAQKGNLTPIGAIPTVPAGIFSSKHKTLDEIKEGAVIAVPNDASNTARAYALLQKAGWITLDKSKNIANVTQDDITENKYKVSFVEMDSLNIPRSMDDFDYAVITGSIVYNAKIDPATALLQEDILDHLILQVVVKEENKDAQWAKDIIAAYHSDEFKAYMKDNNKGLWYVPEELK